MYFVMGEVFFGKKNEVRIIVIGGHCIEHPKSAFIVPTCRDRRTNEYQFIHRYTYNVYKYNIIHIYRNTDLVYYSTTDLIII